MPIFLASASPRRQELLKTIVPEFLVVIPTFQESNTINADLDELICQNTIGKCNSIPREILPASYCLISSDTVVVWRKQVMGKPSSQEEALRFLRNLSGDHHDVKTGISIRIQDRENSVHRYFTESTGVDFYTINEKEMISYVKKYNPLDKAGGYGIQEIPSHWIQNVEGEFNNVVGLPVQHLQNELTWLNQFFNLLAKRIVPLASNG